MVFCQVEFCDSARIEAAFRKYFHRASPKQKQDSFEILVLHGNVIRYMTCRQLGAVVVVTGSLVWCLLACSSFTKTVHELKQLFEIIFTVHLPRLKRIPTKSSFAMQTSSDILHAGGCRFKLLGFLSPNSSGILFLVCQSRLISVFYALDILASKRC